MAALFLFIYKHICLCDTHANSIQLAWLIVETQKTSKQNRVSEHCNTCYYTRQLWSWWEHHNFSDEKNLNRTTVIMYAIYEINEFQSCMQEPKMMAFPSCLFVLWKHTYEDQKVPHPPLKNPIPVWHFKFRRNFSCASLDKSFIKPWVCNNNITDPLSSSMPLCLNQQLLQPQLQQHCMRKPKHLDEHNPGFQNQNPFSVHQFLCNLNAISIPEKVISHVRIHLNRKEHNTCSVKFLCILFGFWKSKKASEQKAFSVSD